jgi:VIT family protein
VTYMLGLELRRALSYSIVFTGIALALFRAVKGRLTGVNMARSALQPVLVGGLAAGGCGFLFGLTTWDERPHPEAFCGSAGKVRRGIALKPDIACAGNIRSNALKDLKRPRRRWLAVSHE